MSNGARNCSDGLVPPVECGVRSRVPKSSNTTAPPATRKEPPLSLVGPHHLVGGSRVSGNFEFWWLLSQSKIKNKNKLKSKTKLETRRRPPAGHAAFHLWPLGRDMWV